MFDSINLDNYNLIINPNVNYIIKEKLNIIEKTSDLFTLFGGDDTRNGSLLQYEGGNAIKSIMSVYNELNLKILEVEDYYSVAGILNNGAIFYIFNKNDVNKKIPFIYINDETWNLRKDFTIYINIDFINQSYIHINATKIEINDIKMIKCSHMYKNMFAIQGYKLTNYDNNENNLQYIHINRTWPHTLHSIYSTFFYFIHKLFGNYSKYTGEITDSNGNVYGVIKNENSSIFMPITYYSNERKYIIKFNREHKDNLFYLVLFTISLIQTNQVNKFMQ